MRGEEASVGSSIAGWLLVAQGGRKVSDGGRMRSVGRQAEGADEAMRYRQAAVGRVWRMKGVICLQVVAGSVIGRCIGCPRGCCAVLCSEVEQSSLTVSVAHRSMLTVAV